MAAREKRSADAESAPVTVADGIHTHGVLNQHPNVSQSSEDGALNGSNSASNAGLPFRVGISEDSNKRWRRAMEDAHAFVYDFGGVHGQGFFGIFDGHAGKDAAEWCGQNFHQYLLKTLELNQEQAVPDLLNATFHSVDKELAALATQKGSSSGCTAAVAFLRLEDDSGRPIKANTEAGTGPAKDGGKEAAGETSSNDRPFSDGLWGKISRRFESSDSKGKDSPSPTPRRVLYTANVGDARAVLCRGGKAVRLTYDHKGSDAQEAKRITDAGGFVMNHRVNGVLAVTRSLGDTAMKEFVVGSPYTTETVLGSEDSFLIIACDGLWDVIEDQEAVDLIKDVQDPQVASQELLRHALSEFSTDNTSIMVVRFTPSS